MEIDKLVRENIRSLKPYTAARHKFTSGILLDANENPFGSVGGDDKMLNRYPDPYQTKLRNAVGNFLGTGPYNLFFGVGSDEIIDLLIRIFCEPRLDNALICEPTYGMYKVSCDINGVETRTVLLNDNFDIDQSGIQKMCDERTKILFLCSPNNPTGNLLDKDKIVELARQLNLIVVVDEAYIDFAEDNGLLEAALSLPNLVVMRTFSKAWGLAAARCGYAIASKEIVDLLFKIKPPYNINRLTEEVVLKAVQNAGIKKMFVGQINTERERLFSELKKRRLVRNVIQSLANFLLFKVDKPNELFAYLAANGVVIRDRSSQHKLEGYLRITIGTKEQNDLFLKLLDSYNETAG